VRPYSKTQRNDFRDAEAIAEAVQRPTMKFVTAKMADQLDLWAPRRVHERLICHRTGIINQIRAFLWSAGLRCAKGCVFYVSTDHPRHPLCRPVAAHVIEEPAGRTKAPRLGETCSGRLGKVLE